MITSEHSTNSTKCQSTFHGIAASKRHQFVVQFGNTVFLLNNVLSIINASPLLRKVKGKICTVFFGQKSYLRRFQLALNFFFLEKLLIIPGALFRKIWYRSACVNAQLGCSFGSGFAV